MKIFKLAIFCCSAALATMAMAQSGYIDLKAKPKPITQAEYDAMVQCTVEKHPDETRRYAKYHVERRDKQTWQENEKDPDSKLLIRSFEGCYEFEDGKPISFSLDAVIYSWYRSHFSKPEKVGK